MSNNKKKILVSGATGMLGRALLNELNKRAKYDIYYVSFSNSYCYDFANLISIEKTKDLEFEAFFHCAAEVNVNLCEKDFSYAMKSNHYYTEQIFERVKANFNFYISTDSVYEGLIGNYKEVDKTNPKNNYALSKLYGEEVSQKYSKNLYIVRTNIFGKNSKTKTSLFEWASKELLLGNPIQGYTNIIFNPLSVQHLTIILLSMLDEKIPFGIYNVGSDTYQSKYDFLVNIASVLGVDKNLVFPMEFEASSEMANRPTNTTMNCEKIRQHIKDLDLAFKTSLDLLMKSEYEKN